MIIFEEEEGYDIEVEEGEESEDVKEVKEEREEGGREVVVEPFNCC